MNPVETGELLGLLEELRGELASAVDELDRTRDAHRRLESLLLAVLDHVPLPIVVVDGELRVRAAAASAEDRWHAAPGRPGSALQGVPAGALDACRAALDQGSVRHGDVPDGYGVALLSEPGTAERYAVLWATR